MDNLYSKRRRLPHFDKPWAVYYATIGTRSRRVLTPAARDIALAAARHFHGRRYDLFAACVMPDHVHLLLQPWFKEQPENGDNVFWSLGELMHSIKSFTAKQINSLEGTRGPVWEEERYDRLVRGDQDLREKFNYILGNPERAKLVAPGTEYPWIWTPDLEFARPKPDVPGKMPATAGGTPALPGKEQTPKLQVQMMDANFARPEPDVPGKMPATAGGTPALPGKEQTSKLQVQMMEEDSARPNPDVPGKMPATAGTRTPDLPDCKRPHA